MNIDEIAVVSLHPVAIALHPDHKLPAATSATIEVDGQKKYTCEVRQSSLNITWSLSDDQVPTVALRASSVLTITVFGLATTFGLALPLSRGGACIGKTCIVPIRVIVDRAEANLPSLSFPVLNGLHEEIGKLNIRIWIHATVPLAYATAVRSEVPFDTSARLFGKALVCLMAMRRNLFSKLTPVPTKLRLAWVLLSKLWRFHRIPSPSSTRKKLVDAARSQQLSTQTIKIDLYDCAPEDLLKQLHDLSFRLAFEVDLSRINAQASETLPALIDDTLSEICRSALLLFDIKERHSDLTYEATSVAVLNGDIGERQRNLFFLRFRWALVGAGKAPFLGDYDRLKIVKTLLDYSLSESPAVASQKCLDEAVSRKSLRPFTTVLASPVGFEAMKVCSVLEDTLLNASNAAVRCSSRRAMARLVQRADKLPSSFYLTLDYCKKPLEIGYGSFSRVFKGGWNGKAVAIKVLNNMGGSHNNSTARMRAYLEIITWKTLQHRFVLPFLGLTKHEAFLEQGSLALISPHVVDGALGRSKIVSTEVLIIDGQTVPYNEPGSGVQKNMLKVDDRKALQYLMEIAAGMAYLHGEGVVHGDLRACNVFLDRGHANIADFGLCIYSEGFSRNYYSMRCGNARWAAPELIAPGMYGTAAAEDAAEAQPMSAVDPQNGIIQTARPTKQSDVYSFGCLCTEIHDVFPLFAGKSDFEIIYSIPKPGCTRPTRPADMLDSLWDLSKACWNDDAALRPTFITVQDMLRNRLNEYLEVERSLTVSLSK